MPKGPFWAQLYFVTGLHIVQPMVTSEKEILTYKYIMYSTMLKIKILQVVSIKSGTG